MSFIAAGETLGATVRVRTLVEHLPSQYSRFRTALATRAGAQRLMKSKGGGGHRRRNRPCPCGSGRDSKACCGRTTSGSKRKLRARQGQAPLA